MKDQNNELSSLYDSYEHICLYDLNGFDITKYDALEVHPCFFADEKSIERCEPDNAEFWSIYLHFKEGGTKCMADCPDQQTADFFAKQFSIMLGLKVQP